MNKKVIWGIVIIMSLALLGVAVTQFIWIKAQVDLDAKSFDDKVIMAMNSVKGLLQEDTQSPEFVEGFYSKKRKSLFGLENDKLSSLLTTKSSNFNNHSVELTSMMRDLFANDLLESINKVNLDRYIKEELIDRGIDLKFDYGVFSNKIQGFVIRNGRFAVQVAEDASSEIREDRGLIDTQYKVQLFNDEKGSPGSLKIYFPNRRSWLWAKVVPSLLSSLFFTGLILLCFAYTIFVIFRQKQVSEMKTDFINNMTHEFKTPIATISLATDSITNNSVISSEDKIKRFAKIIKQENKRMLNQVEKVLQTARIDKQDFNLKLTSVNINEIVTQASENSRLKVMQREGSLTTDLKANNPIIEADMTHISNIIHNLLDNAEKYSSEKPVVHISTLNKAKGVIIKVKDNGIGMPKDSLKHIFDKFYRVHTGNRHDVKGFGLGLSYVKALVDAHSGSIEVASELGKGSTFTLFLPYHQKENS